MNRFKKIAASFRILLIGMISAALSTVVLDAHPWLSDSADADQAKTSVTLIIHLDQPRVQPAAHSASPNIEVSEHKQALRITSGPNEGGPKQVVIVLDANVHQRAVVGLEKETAERLLGDLDVEKARGAILSYGAEIHASGELTDDFDGLKSFNRSIQADSDKRNRTILMFDAMKRAMEILGSGSGTKALVLFAEGNDGGSAEGWKTVARLAESNHVACYVVLFADHTFYGTKAIRHYGWDLVELTPKTGGKFWEAGSNTHKAQRSVAEIKSQIDSQMLLEVAVANPGSQGKFHAVKVTTSGHRVFAQSGYFD